jgi:hypothetical protein
VPGDEEAVAALLVQAVGAPPADLMGRPIAAVDFWQRDGALGVSLGRQAGWRPQERAHTRRSAGEVLVLQGEAEALARVAGAPACRMLGPCHGEARRGHGPRRGAQGAPGLPGARRPHRRVHRRRDPLGHGQAAERHRGRAGWLQTARQGWSQALIRLVLFAGVGVGTQGLADAATTALVAPVAVSLAHALGPPPAP